MTALKPEKREPVICPSCKGERRINGYLCPRCLGDAQIPRSWLRPDKTPPFERAQEGGLSKWGIRALGFDQMCQCGHEYGLHAGEPKTECAASADEEVMDEIPSQGPAPTPEPRGPYDFRRFDRIMAWLQEWRSDDHEDNIVMPRSHIIEIIEGVKALRHP